MMELAFFVLLIALSWRLRRLERQQRTLRIDIYHHSPSPDGGEEQPLLLDNVVPPPAIVAGNVVPIQRRSATFHT